VKQVPADRVIALLTQQLADLHRENAILTIQVQLLEEQATPPVPETAPSAVPLPPVPSSTDVSEAAAA